LSLPIPDLDDRRFQDLVDEAKHRLALHCPEWSDHNVSDPGVTLIELFAHMVDQLNFRLNQVPDRLYLQMLELMGIRRLPPGAATAELTFWLAAEARRPLTVPALTQVATPRRADVLPTTFTVPEELPITPCGFREVGTGRAGGGVVWREAPLHEDSPVVCFADPPAVDDALYVRLDASAPACVIRLRLRCDPAFGQGVDPIQPPLVWEVGVPGDWLPCPCSADTTGGLNTDGEVVLHLPAGLTASPTVLRCRVTDADVPRYELSPQVQGIEAGTIGATAAAYHADIVEDELLGLSDGHPGQRFSLARPPLTWPAGLRATPAVLEVDEGGEREQWTRVDDFARSGEEDHHYTLDAAAGEVAFGPAIRHRPPLRRSGRPGGLAALHRALELHGAVPARGARIVMRRYMTGGGEAGNVAAGQLCVVKTNLPFVKRAENRLAAAGGVAAETMEEVRVRGPIELRTLERAVTAEDYEQFALRDSRVARVRCYAATVEHGQPSIARLLIVPRVRLGLERPLELSELEPSAELQESVRAELEPRRVIGASFEVASPTYIGLRIDARVLLRGGFEPQVVERAAERALAQFFHPTLGGPDGHGWPFGRAVYSGMAYLVLQRVTGVELVEDVRFIPVNLRTGTRGDHTQGFTLASDELIVSRAHAVAATSRDAGS
jgi:predicted phage baseplate assembly protein